MVTNARRTARTTGLIIGLLLALGGVAAGSDKEAGEESAAPAPVPEPAPAAVPEPAPAPPKPPQVEEKPGIKVTPYGRVEMDVIFSSRGTNPLDPRQFNGYSTAAGPQSVSSSTFNPRFSVLGLQGDISDGLQKMQMKVEFDFYSTDSANLITPRLRLAYIQYTRKGTRATFGMDWLPVAQLLPDIMDFSVMGYGGNLWQRLPQATLRQSFGKHWEVLGSVFRFERGFTLQPKTFVSDPFTDPVKMPFVGARVAYQNWGIGGGGMAALSGAYRQFESPLSGRKVKSDLINLEIVVPVTNTLKWAAKIGRGQGLGDEFFRFGQAFNGDNAIRTIVGWTQLSYSGIKRWNFAGGWGDDDPNNADLLGISSNSLNYRHNQRLFGNAIYDVFEHVKVGLELNHLRTNWTSGDFHSANQAMASIFFAF